MIFMQQMHAINVFMDNYINMSHQNQLGINALGYY